MTLTLDDFYRLKERVAELTRRKDVASGELKQLLSQLEAEFGCTTLEDGEKKLAKLRKEEASLYAQYLKGRQEFEAEWGDLLKKGD